MHETRETLLERFVRRVRTRKAPRQAGEPTPIKDANPPEAEIVNPPPEVPKVGSRDAPGG